jgi:hypothetical protein
LDEKTGLVVLDKLTDDQLKDVCVYVDELSKKHDKIRLPGIHDLKMELTRLGTFTGRRVSERLS